MLQPGIVFRKSELGNSDANIGMHKLKVVTVTHIYYIDVKDIIRIQSISNYSKLFFKSGQTMIVSKILAHFDEQLNGGHFSRIHRTHLVNLLYLKGYLRGNGGKVSLSNNEILPVSRRRKKMLQEKMMLLSA